MQFHCVGTGINFNDFLIFPFDMSLTLGKSSLSFCRLFYDDIMVERSVRNSCPHVDATKSTLREGISTVAGMFGGEGVMEQFPRYKDSTALAK